MPAYNYFPATYQPSYYQNPYMQNMQNMQMVQQNQNQQVQANGIIWVGSDAEADAYPIAPNNAVVMWNRSAPVVYIKQADASGRPSMKSYDLVERTKTASSDAVSSSAEAEKVYATKEEIDAVAQAIEVVKSDIKTLKKSIRRKAESEDDDE